MGGVSKKVPSRLTCAGAQWAEAQLAQSGNLLSASPTGEVVHCVFLPVLPSVGPVPLCSGRCCHALE